MSRGQGVARGVLNRIATSTHQLTVVFPPTQPSDSVVPINPFPGGPPQALPTPEVRPTPLTIPYLWVEAGRPGELMSPSEQRRVVDAGWVTDATAMARVRATDVVESGGTLVFDRAAWVEHGGKQYRVLAVTPVNASFAQPISYAVWVQGDQQQR